VLAPNLPLVIDRPGSTEGPNSFTVIADIGAYSVANPPDVGFFVPTGFQFSPRCLDIEVFSIRCAMIPDSTRSFAPSACRK
jgi:hypothetical protein